MIVLVPAVLVGARFAINHLLLVLGYLIVVHAFTGFTAMSIPVASLINTKERFVGIVGAVSMPLFFASNALYPIEIVPEAIKVFAEVNPLTYAVDAVRNLVLYSNLDISVDLLALTLFNILVAVVKSNKIIE